LLSIYFWDLSRPDGEPVAPHDELPPCPSISRGSLLVLHGRAPIWRYAMALHFAHGCPAGAVATFDPRLGCVVVMTHSRDWTVGEVLEIEIPE